MGMGRGGKDGKEGEGAVDGAEAVAQGPVRPAQAGRALRLETAQWLLGEGGVKTLPGTLQGTKVKYSKGKRIAEALRANPVVECASAADTQLLGRMLLKDRVLVCVERKKPPKGTDLRPKAGQVDFVSDMESIYVWTIKDPVEHKDLPVWMSYAAAVAVLLLCLFPIWPMWMRLVVSYVAQAFLALLVVIMIVRLVLNIGCRFIGMGDYYLFPHLYDDKLDLVHLFTPVWGKYNDGKKKKKKKKTDDDGGGKAKAADDAADAAGGDDAVEGDGEQAAAGSEATE